MATATKTNALTARQLGGVPYGNAWRTVYTLETNASGVMADSDLSTALTVGTVVRLGILPGGLQLQDLLAIQSVAATAATTAKIGFAYVDGVDSTSVPQDDDYFFAALATNAAGRTTASNTAVKPEILPKDAWLILTVAGAAHAKASRLDLIVSGVNVGLS